MDDRRSTMDDLGIYVHVPFCSAICNYCNFNRGLFDEAQKTRFVQAVVRELSLASASRVESDKAHETRADTLYFGGGTPSLLAPGDVRAIIDTARRAFLLTPDAEITLEANPESVDTKLLEGFRSAGINRLSFGVQSFLDDELKRLSRLHSAARAEQALDSARAAGFENISLDLMMWLPGQNVDRWLASVERAIANQPDHLSLYILEVYPHLPLRQAIAEHGWTQAEDEDVADMYETAMSMLETAGFEQYEISNVARPGRQSRHNLKYWTDGEWLGFGPGAHSTRDGTRWRNVSATDEYIARIGASESVVAERRSLSPAEQLGDAVFTGLRLTRGIDVRAVSERYGVDILREFGSRLAPFEEAGLLVRDAEQMRLTRRGMLLANEVMAVFV
jgi:oxygen-independent coproporphyrinogen-3 oxidase